MARRWSSPGIVTNPAKKKDAKAIPSPCGNGRPTGVSPVPCLAVITGLFSDRIRWQVLAVIGSRSSYNGNDDGMLRVNPQKIMPIEDLPRYLKGELQLELPASKLSKAFVDEVERCVKSTTGQFTLRTTVQNEEDSFVLESGKRFFPENRFLEWLDKHGLSFSLRVITNGKAD